MIVAKSTKSLSRNLIWDIVEHHYIDRDAQKKINCINQWDFLAKFVSQYDIEKTMYMIMRRFFKILDSNYLQN